MNQFPLLATGGYFLFFICLYYLDSQLFSELRSESNIDLVQLFHTKVFISMFYYETPENIANKKKIMLLHQKNLNYVPHL